MENKRSHNEEEIELNELYTETLTNESSMKIDLSQINETLVSIENKIAINEVRTQKWLKISFYTTITFSLVLLLAYIQHVRTVTIFLNF